MPATPTTKKGVRTFAKVLEAARTVFARDGYVEARMSDIAEQAGLSTGGLYRYFTDKPDVFAALIADLHEELYRESGHTTSRLETDPRAALIESNRGYVQTYFDNRDVMRAFIEAASVDARFREIWWRMRQRHVDRFASAYRALEGEQVVPEPQVELLTYSMACMVEQCCYVWFAQEAMTEADVSVEDAVAAVSDIWTKTFFLGR